MTTEQNVVELVTHTPFAAATIIYAARICKKSVEKSDTPAVILMNDKNSKAPPIEDLVLVGAKDKTLIEKCILEGHDSIFEHAVATFKAHFSRACQSQMLRHRIASYSAESSRAVNMSKIKDVKEMFFIPHIIKHHTLGADIKPAHSLFWDCIGSCMATYRAFIEMGIPVEDARYVLPLALMQPVIITMNIRQWRHVIAERSCKHAQFEIRYIVKEIRRLLTEINPLLTRGAEKYERCVYKDTCGECLTNWEGINDDDSTKEI
jgi:thymidylate synthase (FAD)